MTSTIGRERTEPRRGTQPIEELYLKRVGERVRLQRAGRGMSRRVLAAASGVSERYLAELERGAGNASLLVLRQIADALSVRIADLTSDLPDPPVDLMLAMHQLERLSGGDLKAARALLADRFGRVAEPAGRVALIGLRGAGKTTLGRRAADAAGVPFIELGREIERARGMTIGEIYRQSGQEGFRRFEYEQLERAVTSHSRAVIATGGSLVTEPATFDLLLSTTTVVWLKASPGDHLDRVAAQGDRRPMEQSRQARDDLEAILLSRTPLYSQAVAVIDTSALGEAAALDELVQIVRACVAPR